MSQCLNITLTSDDPKKVMPVIQKKARASNLEGTAQVTAPSQVTVMVCGQKETINEFVDFLHKEAAKKTIANIEIVPFIKTKDYRGVFRIIE
jgi:acylphosphatase